MKRAVFITLLLFPGIATADEGMQDNLTGIDPITNLPTYAIIGLKRLAVGTDHPDPATAVEVYVAQNATTPVFVCNDNGGVNAAAQLVAQTGSCATYGTAPWVNIETFGPGYVGLGPGTTPFFVPGNSAVAYEGGGALVFDTASLTGEFAWSKRSAGVQVEIMDLAPAGLRVDPLGGSGTRCLQTDNAGNVRIAAGACGTGTGTVTSVTGTAGRIVVAPSSPNPVVDLATFGTASTCAWANVVTDAWGRTTCTANTAPQPAGNYITALTHDAIASGPGSASTEVVGITDGTSVDHPVAAGAWTNGQALALDGSSDIHTVPFQAPIAGNTCGSNTFATSISTAGALTCTQPAFSNLSGSLACGQLPAFGGDLTSAGATCSVQVQAVEETSGPARLAINAIPDLGSGNPAILNRPGGTGTVVGSSVASIVSGHTPQTMFWSWNLLTSAALSNRYMCEGGQDNGTATCNEYPVLQSFSHVTLALNVTTNSCTGVGTPTFQVDLMKNGSIIVNLPVSCGTTGIVNTGSVAFAAAAGDTVGLVYDGTAFGTGIGGGTSAFVTARFDP